MYRLAFFSFLVLLPGAVLAQTTYQRPPSISQFESAGGFLNVLNNVIGWIFTLLLVLAVIFILYAAFKYLTAQGDPKNIQTANKMLLYAAIAVAIAVLSRSIPVLIRQFVGSGAQGGASAGQTGGFSNEEALELYYMNSGRSGDY